MIKDIVVNLSIAPTATSPATTPSRSREASSAHLAGVAFGYEPIIPPTSWAAMPAGFIDDAARARATRTPRPRSRLRRGRRSAPASRPRSASLDASSWAAPTTFGRIARRFDLAVVGQAEPNKGAPEELIVEAALFDPAGRCWSCPTSRRHRSRSNASWCAGTAAAPPRARSPTRCRCLLTRQNGRRRHRHRRARQERRGARRRHRAASRASWPQRRASSASSRPARDVASTHPVARRRYRRRPHRDGRLRPLAPARIHPRRRDARHPAAMTVPVLMSH